MVDCGPVRFGMVRSGVVGFGRVRDCLRAGLRFGGIWCGGVGFGGAWLGEELPSGRYLVRCGLVWSIAIGLAKNKIKGEIKWLMRLR